MSGYIGKEALGALADDSVSTAKLADGAVTAAKIADGTIVAAEIASGAVTSAKMDTNIAVSGTLQGTVITATTGFAPDAQDGAYLGTSSLQFSDLFLADSATISLGDDSEVTLTHVHDTGILLNGAMQLQFSDASQFINAPSATVLDINATDEIELNATAVDLNGTLDVSGTGLITGVLTTGGGVVSDTTNTDALGTTSVTWSDAYLGDGAVLGFGEDQDVTLTHVADTGLLLNSTRQLQFNDSSQYIAASSAADLDIAATTDINLNCTTVDINAAANISGAAIITGVLTTGGGIISDTTNTDALGSSSVTWADAYLGDGSVVYFGEDQDITLTHVADSGLNIKHANTGDDKYPTVTLQTGDNNIAADDLLGVLNFQAPSEGAGTDAIAVAAGIEAFSEGDFSATNNATTLAFKTGASEPATRKMWLTSDGKLGIADSSPANILSVTGSADFSGSVGIGKTAPTALLDILGGTGSEVGINIKSSGAAGNTARLTTNAGDDGQVELLQSTGTSIVKLVGDASTENYIKSTLNLLSLIHI